jgi:hypothetical protein
MLQGLTVNRGECVPAARFIIVLPKEDRDDEMIGAERRLLRETDDCY